MCRPWASLPITTGTTSLKQPPSPLTDVENAVTRVETMPPWIPKLAGAAYTMHDYTSANPQLKMSRAHADPLVGLPSLIQRNYSAADTLEVNLQALWFAKRKNYYGMFVNGFVFDKVVD